MIVSFIIGLYRFVLYLFLGLKSDPEFRALLTFLVLLLIGSTIFYMQIECWSAIDSLYFSIMTMSTVGYGDFSPTSNISKIFTMIYTFMSIGMFASFTAKIVAVVLKRKKMKHTTKI